MSEVSKPVKRPRHLMDPNNPVRPVNDRALTNVQRWVVSVLAVTTILHLSVGLVVAAYFLGDGLLGAKLGLCAIGAAFGVISAVVGRVIHRKPVLSPWLALGLIPGIAGAVLVVLS
jgi:hypothetical protein